ncbi:hypothetical protein AcetOrient_orf03631 [Acetobacter orientalis]|uniref:Uncharacterized protein n=1 Tax=Acetobacter orientalis TaxID=146474 RepID=A0A2Z5ZJR0_9PROT|nr:hypothetical protein AcetOrient_orf03631 [Acetobacter orientalis]
MALPSSSLSVLLPYPEPYPILATLCGKYRPLVHQPVAGSL